MHSYNAYYTARKHKTLDEFYKHIVECKRVGITQLIQHDFVEIKFKKTKFKPYVVIKT